MDYKYVSIDEKKHKAQKSVEKLAKKNRVLEPVIINGTKIVKTWWGKAWVINLERYSDFENRIGRGRSYVRNGAVIDLEITPGFIKALVQGSRVKPYKITIEIKPIKDTNWNKIIGNCTGKISSLQELIEGKFPKELEELFTAKGDGLFPTPREIAFDCSCPDYASMCKHIAAVLYGVGSRLDNDPSLFFILRDVNIEELISSSLKNTSAEMLKKAESKSKRILSDSDIDELFGVDLEIK